MGYSVDEKWGDAAKAGFTQIPDVLFKAQRTLGLTTTELTVLLNICTAWWKSEEKPFPSAAGISRRMGVRPRTVQRAIHGLIEKGVLKKHRLSGKRGRRYQFDLAPLIETLKNLALTDPYFLAGQNKHVDR